MHTLPDNLTIGTDGALYRAGDYATPVRDNYARHHRTIGSAADLKASVRAGAYAWPGGYALYFLTSDGAALSYQTVRRHFRAVVDSVRTATDDGWRVVALCSTADDDTDVYCDHCGAPIV